MSAAAAVDYICSIMTIDDTLPLKVLLSRLERASGEASRYFHRYCQNVKDLQVFLNENPDIFFVENKKVALYDDELEIIRDNAVTYFKNKMKECYQKPVNYMDFKNKHYGQAPDDIQTFLCRFYPKEEFKKFFSLRPNVFCCHHENVFLIEVETVRFYERYLKRFGSMHFSKFRGHIGHASPDIQKYINANFLGPKFRDFLENNNSIFRIDNKGFVHYAGQ